MRHPEPIPSLTQYSSTLVFSTPLKRMPMPRLEQSGIVKKGLAGSLERRSGGCRPSETVLRNEIGVVAD